MIGQGTERLIFRQWKKSDYPKVADFFSKKENAKYVGGILSRENAWRLIATYLGMYHLNGYSYYAVEEKESGHFIGAIGLYDSEHWPEPEMGYWLLPEGQGKGYGVEGATAVKQYAEEVLKFESLVSFIASANEPSKKLSSKIGGKYEKKIDLLDFGEHEVYRYW